MQPMCDLSPFMRFKNPKNTHGGVLLLVKLQASKLYKWQQIVQNASHLYLRMQSQQKGCSEKLRNYRQIIPTNKVANGCHGK